MVDRCDILDVGNKLVKHLTITTKTKDEGNTMKKATLLFLATNATWNMYQESRDTLSNYDNHFTVEEITDLYRIQDAVFKVWNDITSGGKFEDATIEQLEAFIEYAYPLSKELTHYTVQGMMAERELMKNK